MWRCLSWVSPGWSEAPVIQGEKNSCPALNGALQPDTSLMTADDLLDDSKADTRAGELRFGMEPLKGRKQVLCIHYVESLAIVPDETDGPAIDLLFSKSDPDRMPVLRVFTGSGALPVREAPGLPARSRPFVCPP